MDKKLVQALSNLDEMTVGVESLDISKYLIMDLKKMDSVVRTCIYSTTIWTTCYTLRQILWNREQGYIRGVTLFFSPRTIFRRS